jgi:UPF0755 protein
MRSWLILVVVLAALGAGLGYVGLQVLNAPGPLQEARDIVIPRGGLDAAGEALKAGGAIGSVRVFRLFGALTSWQGRLRAAELSFPAQASLAQVLAVLRNGHPVQHKVTFPEGLTAARIGQVVARAVGLEGDIVVPDEASVLPETYLYERGMSVASLMQRGQSAMRRALETAWRGRAADVGVRSAAELLIVASMVERETHLGAERPLVARVFYNRLAQGMKLQSDPTVVYAASGGDGELPSGLSRAELDLAGPYNTYASTGLPVGPICSPGVAAIDAAAHPARSAALYFVADGRGGHVFSDSLEEHLQNVRRYRALSR